MSNSLTRYLVPDRRFPTTRWSVVRKACATDCNDCDLDSLQAVCVSYWYPLYAWSRHSGWEEEDARDLIQSFFERLVEKGFLADADPGKGTLRSFLLTCLKRHAKDMRMKAWAARRDARRTLSLDFEWAEGRYHDQASCADSPDTLYDKRWAHTLLHYALELLTQEMAEAGKQETFEVLKPCLGFQQEDENSHSQLALRLGLSKGALKSQIFRLRKRFHEILRKQVAITLGEGENPKAELTALMVTV